MTSIYIFFSVLIAAATPMLEVWIAVPAGVLAGLPMWSAIVAGFIGNSITVILVIFAGSKLRLWWATKRGKTNSEPKPMSSRTAWVIKRFGVPGLAFLGPVLIGSHIAAAAAVVISSRRPYILYWFLFALAVYAIVSGVLTDFGVTWRSN